LHAANVLYADGITLLEIVRRHLPQREFGWDESLGKLTGRTTADEWEQVVALLQEYDYPQFVLKGILTNQDQTVILVEYQETTTLLKLGDTLAGWMASSIADGAVEFTQGQRSFLVRIGR
jgi:glyoxylate carboligase